nr:hypothetical protein Iba_chr14aCG0860 [Ipomoea batatas]GMD84704.1 hypothetical protein Iba_scaffold52873CG0020 [Ipomoea batatas]
MASKALNILFIICLIQYCGGFFEAEAINVRLCQTNADCQTICPPPVKPGVYCYLRTHLCVCDVNASLKNPSVKW